MRSLLKRFTAVATAVIILFGLTVSVSAAEDGISLATEELKKYSLDTDFLYSYNTESDLTNLTGIIDSLSSSYCSDVLIYSYSGSYGARYYGAVNLRYCSKVETANGYIYSVYNGGEYAKDLEQTSKFSSNTNYASLASYYSLSDTNAVLTFFIPKTDLYNFYVCYGTVKTLRETFNYNIEQYALSSRTDTPDWSNTGIVYRGKVHFFALNKAFRHVSSVVSPDQSEKKHLYGVAVGELENKKGFIEWLKSEGKISLINSSGYSFAENQIDLIVDIFESYGGSPLLFMGSLIKTFNITTDFKAVSSLVQTLQQLYSDYLKYKRSLTLVEINPSDSVHPHWRINKEDTSLVTDQADDTSDISLLREILRTLIVMPQNIAANLSYVQQGFTDLLFNFQRQIALLDSLPEDSHNSFSSDIDAIINAINNSSGSSGDISVDVNITDERQKEIDDFFIDWNLKYSNKLNEKIPVASQLSDLFSEDFFEKCGIDVNEDGEVYEYYHPELATLSSGSVSADKKLVNDFISNFDGADSSFLNDVQYSSDVPDFSITIKGQKHSIFNFNLYARYRTQIHTIMIFCIYSLYFLCLFKSLPNIIGNVSDVKNAFSDYHGGDS